MSQPAESRLSRASPARKSKWVSAISDGSTRCMPALVYCGTFSCGSDDETVISVHSHHLCMEVVRMAGEERSTTMLCPMLRCVLLMERKSPHAVIQIMFQISRLRFRISKLHLLPSHSAELRISLKWSR